MAEVLNVDLRETRGKHDNRRLRGRGAIPAVLYGHGEETVCLSVPAHEIQTALRHGSRLVELAGAVSQQAFIRELQWDTWGTNVLHVDFTRISAHEKVQVEVALELRGEAPGLKEGGVVEQLAHQIEIECEASDIPDRINVNVNQLNLHDSITAGDLKFPGTASILCEPDRIIVQCVEPAAVPEEEEAAPAGEAEPEVIGRKPEEEEG
ncbi:MAG: 50S ribosomal protein L25 [Planctomycetota bacterium]